MKFPFTPVVKGDILPSIRVTRIIRSVEVHDRTFRYGCMPMQGRTIHYEPLLHIDRELAQS
jgi:hypothetical protein